MQSTRILTIMLLLGVYAARAAAEDGIVIHKNPTTVVTRTFDPKHQPTDMPPLKPHEAAVTDSVYSCGVQIEVENTKTSDGNVRCTVVAVVLTMNLAITEWLPADVLAKTKNHEEGHREIAEIFYEDAEKIGQEVAQKHLGKQLEVKDDDTQAAIKTAATECCKAYLDAVEIPAQRAQERYDDITDHGRNKVPEKTAVKRAVGTTASSKPSR